MMAKGKHHIENKENLVREWVVESHYSQEGQYQQIGC
jgi:hypothetical protein